MEERGFPAAEIRLLDDDEAGGTLTEAGGEPTFIRTVNEDSFENLDLIFFAGTPDFTTRNLAQARRSGARIIDLSGALGAADDVAHWIPALDGALPPPGAPKADAKTFFSPPAGSIIACTIAAALSVVKAKGIALVIFQPVSERGQRGVLELESQTVNLLSFQPISRELYDAQVAFNLLSRYGPASHTQLERVRSEIVTCTLAYLRKRILPPSIQLIQAPVFYAYAFSAFATLECACEPAGIEKGFAEAGAQVAGAGDLVPDNISVAGESLIQVARVEQDSVNPNGYWIWGATDNVRLAAVNALSIAEKLLEA